MTAAGPCLCETIAAGCERGRGHGETSTLSPSKGASGRLGVELSDCAANKRPHTLEFVAPTAAAH